MRMKQLVGIGGLVLGSSAAMAGLITVTPVTVTVNPDTSGSASGSMSATRFSKNDVEYIGCGVRRVEDGANGAFVFGFCQASNAAGDIGFCETENPALIASIGDQDDYSYYVLVERGRHLPRDRQLDPVLLHRTSSPCRTGSAGAAPAEPVSPRCRNPVAAAEFSYASILFRA